LFQLFSVRETWRSLRYNNWQVLVIGCQLMLSSLQQSITLLSGNYNLSSDFYQQLPYFFYLYTFQVIVFIYDANEFTSKFSFNIFIKLHYNSYYIFGLHFHGIGNVRTSFIQHNYLYLFHVPRIANRKLEMHSLLLLLPCLWSVAGDGYSQVCFFSLRLSALMICYLCTLIRQCYIW